MNDRKEQFGDTPELQDELAALIVAGKKRATSSLARWYGEGGLPWPIVGETWAVADGQGRVHCSFVTRRVQICAFREVDIEHAAAEGEQNGSLEQWREIHRAFFTREATRHNFMFDDDTLVVLERFEVLSPRSMHDQRSRAK